MGNGKIEKRTEFLINVQGILMICIIILSFSFALGWIASNKRTENEVTTFSREELERIVELQKMEDDRNSGAEIFAYKDKYGNLMIGWDYNNKKK